LVVLFGAWRGGLGVGSGRVTVPESWTDRGPAPAEYRINWLGISRCRLVKVDGLDLHVEHLDAVDGTPVLDIKPWF
jgi:hypothetical protein